MAIRIDDDTMRLFGAIDEFEVCRPGPVPVGVRVEGLLRHGPDPVRGHGRATRSAIVGTPSVLVPPPGLGITAVRTGGGNHVPADIRFQTLHRLSSRHVRPASRLG
jgi:hypothetical protein